MRDLCFIFVMWFLCLGSHALATPISMDLDTDHVDISLGFSGSNLTVFGSTRNKKNLTIIVKGPLRDMIVRKKTRVMGAWMHTSAHAFQKIPLFYYYATANGDKDVWALENLIAGDEAHISYKEALLRNKRKMQHYAEAPIAIHFYEGTGLFRADFPIPSNVPVGEYTVEVSHGDKGKRHIISKSFDVSQIGNNARMRYFATEYAFFYGLACIAFAVFAGWFSNRVRYRQ